MTKADAIRQITKSDFGLSAKQIRDLVWLKYGLRVESNQINSVVGAFKDRVLVAGYSPLLLAKARDFYRAVGDARLCKVLLGLVVES